MELERRAERAQMVFGRILMLANKLQILSDRIFTELTLKQWFLLILILRLEEDDLTITRLADFSGTSRQNVSQILGHLEAKGFVVLSPSKADARARAVSLTPKSYSYFVRNDRLAEERILELFDGIDDDRLSHLDEILEMLQQNVERHLDNRSGA